MADGCFSQSPFPLFDVQVGPVTGKTGC